MEFVLGNTHALFYRATDKETCAALRQSKLIATLPSCQTYVDTGRR